MTTYNECWTIILNDGRVIVCQENGYRVRTINSSFGHDCIDGDYNNYGPRYWKKEAMKHLDVSLEDIAMQVKGKVCFTN
jgi:hypothetical protein